jgi:polysaccharide biosynthesis/export protein
MASRLVTILALLPLGACATGPTLEGSNMPAGVAAYSALPAPPTIGGEYRIAPYDTVAITVFQEPDLSTPANTPLQVDARGNINMPLVGQIAAAGRTTRELSAAITAALAQRYLKNPQVSVAVASSVPDKITVQGDVNEPGIFDIKGKTTLLQAISLARGETKLASTKEVAVFRTMNGQRLGALFNVDEIRRGSAPDPELTGNDVVIVGHSRNKEAWQNILSVNPLYGVFRVLTAVP